MSGLPLVLSFKSVKSAEFFSNAKYPYYWLTVVSDEGYTYGFPMSQHAYDQLQSLDELQLSKVNKCKAVFTDYKHQKKIKVVGF